MGLLSLVLRLKKHKPRWKVKDSGYQKVMINGRIYYVKRFLEINKRYIKFIDRDGVVRTVYLKPSIEEGYSISERIVR